MVPRGMSMMMGRGGYHPPGGLPVDYMYDPYMDGGMGYYGGRPPFHPGRGHPGKYIYSVCIFMYQAWYTYINSNYSLSLL